MRVPARNISPSRLILYQECKSALEVARVQLRHIGFTKVLANTVGCGAWHLLHRLYHRDRQCHHYGQVRLPIWHAIVMGIGTQLPLFLGHDGGRGPIRHCDGPDDYP